MSGDSLIDIAAANQAVDGGASPTSPLHLKFVLCDTSESRSMFRWVMNNFHSYMKYKDTCNRRLNWLVYANNQLAGAIGVNSAILALSPRDTYIGWTKEEKYRNLNRIGNNYRFAMIIPNIGGQVLARWVKIAPAAWEARYGDPLVLLETLVKPPWKGTVYKATNWILVGQTRGVSFSKAPLLLWQKEKGIRGQLARDSPSEAIKKYGVGGEHYHITKSEPKLIYLLPLRKNWREYLLEGIN